MSLISIRLPDKLDAELTREAEHCGRPRSELVREAIADFLARREKARFLAQIARAAAEPDDDAIAMAEEALPFDNEALDLVERAAREPAPPRYRRPRRKA
jgi:predicted transcriptional regulator